MTYDVSELHQLAGRDYEDLLQATLLSKIIGIRTKYVFQCSLPAFAGLFVDVSLQLQETVDDVLYTLTNWHSLAKLAVHTDSTLMALTKATEDLGNRLRLFSDVSKKKIDTYKTPREQRKRMRRVTVAQGLNISGEKCPKEFKLDTSKLHALGDYVEHIKKFGPADIISTQTVSTIFTMCNSALT